MNTDHLPHAARALGLTLSPSQERALLALRDLLTGRAVDLGMVAEGDRDRILQRHVLDSLRAVAAVQEADRAAYDLGSGAGLPGVVVAIASPRLEVRLVEVRRKRVAWLELVVEELGLSNAVVVPARVEELSEPVDVCFARALAPIERSWELAASLLHPGGRLVYFAGRRAEVPSEFRLAKNIRILEGSSIESGGPLVMITRQ